MILETDCIVNHPLDSFDAGDTDAENKNITESEGKSTRSRDGRMKGPYAKNLDHGLFHRLSSHQNPLTELSNR